MTGTNSLAGFVTDASGRVLTFALISNNAGPTGRTADRRIRRDAAVVRVQRMSARDTSVGKPTVGRAVDWGFAATVGARLARPGPRGHRLHPQAGHRATRRAPRCDAELPVREVTGLNEGGEVPDARIVDRAEWIRAASQSMRVMTGGSENRQAEASSPAAITGAQTGAVLAFVSSGILGQYDPFGPDGGELLLVYPNVIAVERQLRVSPADFRLWVCLHEVTHRVQFRANPWLADHMSSRSRC